MVLLENAAIGIFLLIPTVVAFIISLFIARWVYHKFDMGTKSKWFVTIVTWAFAFIILMLLFVNAFGYYLGSL